MAGICIFASPPRSIGKRARTFSLIIQAGGGWRKARTKNLRNRFLFDVECDIRHGCRSREAAHGMRANRWSTCRREGRCQAVRIGRRKILQSAPREIAFHRLQQHGRIIFVEVLLCRDLDQPHHMYKMAAMEACRRGHVDIIHTLLCQKDRVDVATCAQVLYKPLHERHLRGLQEMKAVRRWSRMKDIADNLMQAGVCSTSLEQHVHGRSSSWHAQIIW